MGETKQLSTSAKKAILAMQINETTEYQIYTNIANYTKDAHNKGILLRIAQEEKAHAEIWEKYTTVSAQPRQWRIVWYTVIARIFGFTFVLKYMEKSEIAASKQYKLLAEVPEAKRISEDEDAHEQELLNLLDEERLQYVGSMVLGLSDALVELSGTLAGLTFALQNNRLVALSGLITGISATLSMTSSEYLSARSDGHPNPLKSCMYTGSVYLFTVVLLVLPYLLFPPDSYTKSLTVMLLTVIVIIFIFTYYISVAKNLSFKQRFFEMAGISLSVAVVSFGIGLLVKQFLGIEI